MPGSIWPTRVARVGIAATRTVSVGGFLRCRRPVAAPKSGCGPVDAVADLGRPRGRPVTSRCLANQVDLGSACSQPSTSCGVPFRRFIFLIRKRVTCSGNSGIACGTQVGRCAPEVAACASLDACLARSMNAPCCARSTGSPKLGDIANGAVPVLARATVARGQALVERSTGRASLAQLSPLRSGSENQNSRWEPPREVLDCEQADPESAWFAEHRLVTGRPRDLPRSKPCAIRCMSICTC